MIYKGDMDKTCDDEVNLSNVTDDENEKNYQFDFYALRKMKRREKVKVYTLSCLLIILSCALVAMVILYVNKKDKKSEILPFSNAMKLVEARRKAYTRIAKYGEDCHSPIGSLNKTICGKNAYCRFLQGTHRCDCANGYVGDGIGDCKDANFVIEFKNPTVKNVPQLRQVGFPSTDELSICFWFKMDGTSTDTWMAFFMYTSVDIDGENDLMLWIEKTKLHVYIRNKGIDFFFHEYPKNIWTHLCWVWKSTGNYWVYQDGKLVKTSTATLPEYRKTFPESFGNVILGQDKDADKLQDSKQMFHGTMTQFFIFSKLLTEDEVVSVYENRPPSNNIVIGWWHFKNMTRGNDIVESAFPSDFELHKSP